MRRFLVKRLLAAVPTLIGISLVTFVVLNLAMGSQGGPAEPEEDYSRFEDRALPLFLNLSIVDARAYAESAVADLRDDRRAPRAARDIARAGGAWLPYVIPALPRIGARQRDRALDALDAVAARIGLDRAIAVAPDRAAFWRRYFDTYGSDFNSVRAARLVHRLVRSDDKLALAELERLDTFCLPAVMEALDEGIPPEAQARLVALAGALAGVADPLDPGAAAEAREVVLCRWRDWWQERSFRYAAFDGIHRVTGAFTETRYGRWLGRLVLLDFGVSTRDGRPILSKLVERLPVTLLLSTLALLVAYGLAIPIGVLSAVWRGSLFDRSTMVILFMLYSLPAFWTAMLLITFFAGTGYLDLFPAQGLTSQLLREAPAWRRALDVLGHLVLPVVCLSLVSLAMLARYQRVGMAQVIDLDFIRTARAKGLTRSQAILRHGLRNGVIPVVTLLGIQIPYLVSGSVVVERIFGIPGMGLETFEAIQAHDNPWLLAAVTVTAVMTLVGMVAADAVYALVDPRIAPGRAGGKR